MIVSLLLKPPIYNRFDIGAKVSVKNEDTLSIIGFSWQLNGSHIYLKHLFQLVTCLRPGSLCNVTCLNLIHLQNMPLVDLNQGDNIFTVLDRTVPNLSIPRQLTLHKA